MPEQFKFERIGSVEIPDYNEYVVLSNKRRVKKDKETGKILNPKAAGRQTCPISW